MIRYTAVFLSALAGKELLVHLRHFAAGEVLGLVDVHNGGVFDMTLLRIAISEANESKTLTELLVYTELLALEEWMQEQGIDLVIVD
jgi:hypothetical protein